VTSWDISRLTSLRVRYPMETTPRDVILRLGLVPRCCFWWLVASCMNDVLSRPLVSQIAPKQPICCEDRESLAQWTSKACSGESTGQSWLVLRFPLLLIAKIRDAAEPWIATSEQGGRFSGRDLPHIGQLRHLPSWRLTSNASDLRCWVDDS
jgi:hypothetical protein